MPLSKLAEIKAKYMYLDRVEAKRQMFYHFLTSHPAPSWQVVLEGLYQMGINDVKCHHMLQDVRRRYGRGTVHVCIDTSRSLYISISSQYTVGWSNFRVLAVFLVFTVS